MTITFGENNHITAASIAGKRFTAFKEDLETLCKAHNVALTVSGHFFICVEDSPNNDYFEHLVNRLGVHEQ